MSVGETLTTADNPDDRRSRPRCNVSVELKLHAPQFHFMLLSRTVNLSSKGAYVRSNRSLPLGVNVTVALHRGQQRNPLLLDAEVVRIGSVHEGRSNGIALRFKNLTELDEAVLRDVIRGAQA